MQLVRPQLSDRIGRPYWPQLQVRRAANLLGRKDETQVAHRKKVPVASPKESQFVSYTPAVHNTLRRQAPFACLHILNIMTSHILENWKSNEIHCGTILRNQGMVDGFSRWCLFCDLEVHPSPPEAPQPLLNDYIDDLLVRIENDEAKRVFENENRITRIVDGRRIELLDGNPAFAMVITLGDRRGADPSFLHFDNGNVRDAEKFEGEVSGSSAHCVVRLTPDEGFPGRYRMLMEETRGIGRTPITRLLTSEFKAIAKDRNERFRNPNTNRMNAYRPIGEVHPRRSKEIGTALDHGSFMPVELFDTSRIPAFDENPEFSVRRHLITVKVLPAEGRSMKEALADLANLGRQNGYDRMRVSWRVPGELRGGSSEMATDLADVGTALFAHRELTEVENALSECAPAINDEFLARMIEKF